MIRQSLDLTTSDHGTNQRLLPSSESCELQHGSFGEAHSPAGTVHPMPVEDLRRRPGGGHWMQCIHQ
jgi:hypothetical protein